MPKYSPVDTLISASTVNPGLSYVTDPDGTIIPAKEYDGTVSKVGTYTFTDTLGNVHSIGVVGMPVYDIPGVKK